MHALCESGRIQNEKSSVAIGIISLNSERENSKAASLFEPENRKAKEQEREIKDESAQS